MGECPICLNNMVNLFTITTPCNHLFCINCFLDLRNIICPLCREDFKKNIPNKLLNILLKNNKKDQPIQNTINIHNSIDFPPLS